MNPMNIGGLFIALVFIVAVLPSALGAGWHQGALTVMVAAGIGYGLGAVIVSLLTR